MNSNEGLFGSVNGLPALVFIVMVVVCALLGHYALSKAGGSTDTGRKLVYKVLAVMVLMQPAIWLIVPIISLDPAPALPLYTRNGFSEAAFMQAQQEKAQLWNNVAWFGFMAFTYITASFALTTKKQAVAVAEAEVVAINANNYGSEFENMEQGREPIAS